MTGDDLIVIAPWLVFGAGLMVIGYRLLTHRGTRCQSPPLRPAQPGRPEDAPPAGRRLQPGTKPASGTQPDERAPLTLAAGSLWYLPSLAGRARSRRACPASDGSVRGGPARR